jgi:hypothetical protein
LFRVVYELTREREREDTGERIFSGGILVKKISLLGKGSWIECNAKAKWFRTCPGRTKPEGMRGRQVKERAVTLGLFPILFALYCP